MPPSGKSPKAAPAWEELDAWMLDWEARIFRRFEALEERLAAAEAKSTKRGSRLAAKTRNHESTEQWPPRLSQEIEFMSRHRSDEAGTAEQLATAEKSVDPTSIFRESVRATADRSSVNLEDALMHAMDGDDSEIPERAGHFIAEVAIQPTVWEAALVLGVPSVGSLGSMSIAFSLCMNIFFQVTFCLIIWTHFLEPQFPELEDLRRWRITVGHDWENVDKTFGTSMVTRICGGDDSIAISNTQRTVLDHISAYTKNVYLASFMTTGSVMVSLAIAVWTLIVLKEVWRAFHFLQALIFVPRGDTDFKEVFIDGARHSIVIESISHLRFFFQLFVTIMRIVVAVALMAIGSQWLALTTQIDEVFLNAVSIAFVLDVDELFFENFIPLPTKVLLSTFRALPRHTVLRHGMDAPPVFNLIVCLGVVLLSYQFEVSPLKARMDEAHAILCNGNQFFAVSMQSATGVIFGTRTKPFNQTESQSNMQISQAVEELNQTEGAEVTVTKVRFQNEYDRYMFTSSVHESFPEIIEHEIHCTDMNFEDKDSADVWGPYRHALHHQLDRMEANRCQEFDDLCGGENASLLRFACPDTCGCNLPYSGLFLNGPSYGCPRDVCHSSSSYQTVLERMECRDMTSEMLSDVTTTQGAGWTAVTGQLQDWILAMVGQDNQDPETLEQMQAIRHSISTNGCNALADDLIWSLFCVDGRHSYTSLIAYCPVTCGCQQSFQPGCPSTCRISSSSRSSTES